MNKPISLKELEEIFNEGFEKTYAEYNKNTGEVKAGLISMDEKFVERYFFNNGIKYLMEKMRELQECEHVKLTDGPSIPRRHGSYKSQVCECGKWRTYDHSAAPIYSKWRSDPIEEAAKQDENL